jgi:hypothetical protein
MIKYTTEENTARQEALYRFLLSRGNKWTSMERCTDTVKEYPAFFNVKSYHNSGARRLLTADIAAINASDDFEKIIISGSRGVKLATEEEFAKFLGAELREVFAKLSRIRKLSKKGSRNLQMDLECRITNCFLQPRE